MTLNFKTLTLLALLASCSLTASPALAQIDSLLPADTAPEELDLPEMGGLNDGAADADTAPDSSAFDDITLPSLPGDLPTLPGDTPPGAAALPTGPNDAFSYDDSAFTFEKSPDEIKEENRKQAYDAALEGILPLRPNEIRQLLERFDRTKESVETPIYPAPKPEVVVQNISLDPGAEPAVVKTAYGHVTTVTFTDTTGSPWPVQDISWAGNFEVIETAGGGADSYTHVFRISPQSEFAYGNMSITLLGLQTPVIITLETSRESVHYRFDAVIGDYGPLAEAPLISTGITTTAGNSALSSALEGVMPKGAVRLNVDGVDGRTSAYKLNETVYVRTPLTLLSPGWNSSVASADGTRVYEIEDASVLLLSDRGSMVRAKLSEREDLLDEH